jgi:carbon storage regulator
MLVLSRQRDETIMIGDDIEITIVDIRGDKVRLGITAPATIPVHRKEVYEAIQRENREAARVKMEDLGSLPRGIVKPVVPGMHRPHMPTTRPVPRQTAPSNGTGSSPSSPLPAAAPSSTAAGTSEKQPPAAPQGPTGQANS